MKTKTYRTRLEDMTRKGKAKAKEFVAWFEGIEKDFPHPARRWAPSRNVHGLGLWTRCFTALPVTSERSIAKKTIRHITSAFFFSFSRR
jgi:hypothetical protein